MLPSHPSSTNSSISALQAWGNRGSGRSILANGAKRALLDRYLIESSKQSDKALVAQELIKGVNSLRAAASPLNSMLKPGSPTRRLLVAGHFEIEYELNSYYGEQQTDIEIVDIRLTENSAKNQKRPALWKAVETKHGWFPSNKPSVKLETTSSQLGSKASPVSVGINGEGENLESAIKILPDHISRGSSSNLTRLGQSFQVLYVPAAEGGKWGWRVLKALGTKCTDQQNKAAMLLAKHMHDAHSRKLFVEWTAHQDGSRVLAKAMEHLIQKNIDLEQRQKIYVSDHTSSEYELELSRRALNMDISDDKWANSRPGFKQLLHGTQFGYAPLSTKYLTLTFATPKGKEVGAAIDFGCEAFSLGKAVKGLGSGALAMQAGISWGVAGFLVATFGEALIASLPKSNKNYYKGLKNQLKVTADNLTSNQQG